MSDQYEWDEDGVERAAKTGAKKATKKAAKGGTKAVAKATGAAVKAVGTIAGSLSGILVPVICIMLITVMITDLFASVFSVEQYEQECPELVRMFLADNYDEFEAKVKTYVNSEEFMAFAADSEFDNGYTKLVYGGTNAYTQDELKGNYNGVQGQKAEWVSYDDKEYSAKSVLETVQDYIDAGVNVSNILINDNYLKGYGEASGYQTAENVDDASADTADVVTTDTLPFDKWINYSYYAIPYYYHWNMGRNSEYQSPATYLGYVYEGSKGGLPNWHEESGYWNFMEYAENNDPSVKDLPNQGSFPNTAKRVWSDNAKTSYKNMTYKDYLKTGFTTLGPTKKNGMDAAYATESRLHDDWLDYKDGKTSRPYWAQGVMLGYKMEITDGFLEKVINRFTGRDEMYNYYPLSKYYGVQGDSKYGKVVDNLYVYDWFDKKSGDKSNYEKYLKKPIDIKTSAKREQENGNSLINTEVENWKDRFAEYFAKEIYYIYPNREYIVDYFLKGGDSEEMNHKRIAFLQRSFYAMATGSELDLELDEEYSIKDGVMTSTMTEGIVGQLNISKFEIKSITPVWYNDLVFNKMKVQNDDTITAAKVNTATYLKNKAAEKDEDITGKTFDSETLYNVELKANYSDDTEAQTFILPVKIKSKTDYDGKMVPDSAKMYINVSGEKETLKKRHLKKLAKPKWSKAYYESQDSYEDEGRTKLENPLDKINMKRKYKPENPKNIDTKLTPDKDNSDFVKKALSKGKGKKLIMQIFDGKLKGKRKINFQYSDHSFLTYTVNEQTDADGNVDNVIIEIYTYYPDVTGYDDSNYRVALGLESGDALQEAFHLLQYTQNNRDKADSGEPLDDINDYVDFSKLLVSLDDESVTDAGVFYTEGDFAHYVADLIAYLESRYNWDSIAKPYANTSKEVTITVGAYQFFGERAHDLLRKICKANKEKALNTLGQALYDECVGKSNWEKAHYAPADADYPKLKELLRSDEGIQVQKDTMAKSIESYVKTAGSMGVYDMKAQAYFCLMQHQSPAATKTVVSLAGKNPSLDTLHRLCLSNPVFASTSSRYKEAYKKIKTMYLADGISGKATKVLKYLQSNKVLGKKYSEARSDMTSGKRYKLTYDCSELSYLAYYYGAGMKISDGKAVNTNCEKQMEWCEKNAKSTVSKFDEALFNLMPGDLIFYKEGDKYKTDHVAIYVNNGQVIDVKKKGKVKQRKLDDWDEKYFVAAYTVLDDAELITGSAAQVKGIKEDARETFLFPNGYPTTEQEAAAYMTTITVPIVTLNGQHTTKTLKVHKKLVGAYTQAFQNMEKVGFPINSNETYTYAWRQQASGTGCPSHHGYGVAIDINSSINVACYTGSIAKWRVSKSPYKVTDQIIKIWKDAGFFWGGDWNEPYTDTMHFTYTNH